MNIAARSIILCSIMGFSLVPYSTPRAYGAKGSGHSHEAEFITARLDKELAEYGIDGSKILHNAESNSLKIWKPVPEHDRSRILLLELEDERKIAQCYLQTLRREGKLYRDIAQEKRIQSIVDRLLSVVPEISKAQIYLRRDDDINACCLADGTIIVNSGTLSLIDDDQILAAILAHEIAHAAAHHGNEGTSRLLMISAAESGLEKWAKNLCKWLKSNENASLVLGVYRLASSIGVQLPMSREMELEADRLGTRYLARAGFNPLAAYKLFVLFEELEPTDYNRIDSWLSTHPTNSERIKETVNVLCESDLGEMPNWEPDNAKINLVAYTIPLIGLSSKNSHVLQLAAAVGPVLMELARGLQHHLYEQENPSWKIAAASITAYNAIRLLSETINDPDVQKSPFGKRWESQFAKRFLRESSRKDESPRDFYEMFRRKITLTRVKLRVIDSNDEYWVALQFDPSKKWDKDASELVEDKACQKQWVVPRPDGYTPYSTHLTQANAGRIGREIRDCAQVNHVASPFDKPQLKLFVCRKDDKSDRLEKPVLTIGVNCKGSFFTDIDKDDIQCRNLSFVDKTTGATVECWVYGRDYYIDPFEILKEIKNQ